MTRVTSNDAISSPGTTALGYPCDDPSHWLAYTTLCA